MVSGFFGVAMLASSGPAAAGAEMLAIGQPAPWFPTPPSGCGVASADAELPVRDYFLATSLKKSLDGD